MDASADLMARWAALISEYEAFRDALRAVVRQPHWPGLGPYIAMLRTEAAATERGLAGEASGVSGVGGPSWVSDGGDRARQAESSLAAKEAMWRTIKGCRGVVALERRFATEAGILGQSPRSSTPLLPSAGSRQDKRSRYSSVSGAIGSRTVGVFVNAVVDDGWTWLRVVTTTRAQLVQELTENGWEWGADEEGDGGEGEGDGDGELGDLTGVSMVGMALDLVAAARANRYKGAYPRVSILLTRIDETGGGGKGAADIARFLRRFRRGVAAHTAALPPDIDGERLQVDIHTNLATALPAPPAPLDDALARMMPGDIDGRLSPTLNVDTSILIALVSDITHAAVPVQPWHTAPRVDEIRSEAQRPGQLLQTLCAAMGGHRLVCTREAARTFRNMVRDMAQASELQRAALLVREEGADADAMAMMTTDRPDVVSRFRALSTYPAFVPDDLMLPIAVVEEDWDLARVEQVVGETGGTATSTDRQTAYSLPPLAACIARDMQDASMPTPAVFFYGWASGHTTVTTNLAARNRIARLVEQHRTSSHDTGPSVCVSRAARSLNGTNPRQGGSGGRGRGGGGGGGVDQADPTSTIT